MRELIADILRLIANHLDPGPPSDAFVSKSLTWDATWDAETTYFFPKDAYPPTVTSPVVDWGLTGGTAV